MPHPAPDTETSSLVIDVRPGERLVVDGAVTVELVQKSGQLARLRVTAPRDVKIERRSTKAVPSMA
jgi:sRNA-binding carbon storage regulator CsrA